VVSPVINVNWLVIHALPNMTYEKPYNFTVVIRWLDDGKLMQTEQVTRSISWYNVSYPLFEVELLTH